MALLESLVLPAAIAVTTGLFRRVGRPAGAVFVPYLLWVAHATALNAALRVLD